MSFDTPLSSLTYKGPQFGPQFLKKLERLGLHTVGDALFYFPLRYDDLSNVKKIHEVEVGTHNVVQGKIISVKTIRTWQKKIFITEALLEDDTAAVRAIWFNQPYLSKILKIGTVINAAGKLVADSHGIYLSNPLYEIIKNPLHTTTHTGRIIPIYGETRGITSKGIRAIIKPVLDAIEDIPEFLPEEILKKHDFPTLKTALSSVHFPARQEDIASAKTRFTFEYLFLLSLAETLTKESRLKQPAPRIAADIASVKQFIASLPFTLTDSQKHAAWAILKHLEKPAPMNLLLNGDVGSGKTVVAALAGLSVIKNGYQTIFMAPTEILARQHFLNFSELFRNADLRIGLITGHDSQFSAHGILSAPPKKVLQKYTKDGKIDLLIGTHALIEKKVAVKKAGLIIIDEQHRFGVNQRNALLAKQKEFVPHLLSLTATPIPRTLALTIFGDMDIAILDEMPKGRKKIITKVVAPANREKAYTFIRDQIKSGFQAFVICPRIAPSENQETVERMPETRAELSRQLWLEVKTVEEEYEKLRTKVFPDLAIARLHGKMKPEEKEKVMADFASGKSDVLVSTSMIEVGVDIPNATVMMIEGAERFGLAQLHQFRGRIGRNAYQSYCLLFTTSASQSDNERLKSMVKFHSGFELAEMDLKMRGPGEFLGEAQSGWPDMLMEALKNESLVLAARNEAKAWLAHHKIEDAPLLQEKLLHFREKLKFA